MTNTNRFLDVLKLGREVDRDSKSGNTLFGVDPHYPGYIKKLSPSGQAEIGF